MPIACTVAMKKAYNILVRKSEGTDWRVMLKWNLEKYSVRMWTAFIWVRMLTSTKLLLARKKSGGKLKESVITGCNDCCIKVMQDIASLQYVQDPLLNPHTAQSTVQELLLYFLSYWSFRTS